MEFPNCDRYTVYTCSVFFIPNSAAKTTCLKQPPWSPRATCTNVNMTMYLMVELIWQELAIGQVSHDHPQPSTNWEYAKLLCVVLLSIAWIISGCDACSLPERIPVPNSLAELFPAEQVPTPITIGDVIMQRQFWPILVRGLITHSPLSLFCYGELWPNTEPSPFQTWLWELNTKVNSTFVV